MLQAVRETDAWEDWVLYMLEAVANTARETIHTIQAIRTLLQQTKQRVRDGYRFYSQDLINNLFNHPYTRVEFVQRDLGVSRITATRYLASWRRTVFWEKPRIGRNNYYVNLTAVRYWGGTSLRMKERSLYGTNAWRRC